MDSTEQLGLKQAALMYLDKSGALQKLREKCLVYANSKQVHTVYNFVLTLNPMELAEINAEFCNLVLNQVSSAANIFQEVCFTAIQTLSLLPTVENSSQVLVHLRVNDIPNLPSYQLDPYDLWSCKADKRFYKFRGVVCSMSTITKYTQAARYYCPVSSCDGSSGHHYIRIHTTGASEFQTIRNDFVCMFCGSTLVEDVACRLLADKVVVQMLADKALKCCWKISSERVRHQSVTVVLRGDLASDVTIGGTYSVIGIPMYMYRQADISVTFEANNIIEVNNESQEFHQDYTCDPTACIPSSVQTLYNDRMSSSWSFVASLAYIFGSDITPAGSYFRLKLGMLLSLVQKPEICKKKTRESRGLNVLAVGSDTVILNRLLMHGASFASCHLHHTGNDSLFATVTKNTTGTGACTIDGGSLMLCRDGICTLGDLTYYKKDCRDSLLYAMEHSAITINIPKKYSEQTLHQQVSVPIRCNIWAYVAANYKSSTNNDIFTQQDYGNIPRIFADPFGMMYICASPDTCWDNYVETCLMNQILTNAVLDETQRYTIQSVVSTEDLQKVSNGIKGTSINFKIFVLLLLKESQNL
ncbi:minichromosome maintenance domain-containing protein 2-like [Ptychodera flava]|uniref:minichromosome maintenance domain-containing protein 2-like n=1 Tax=Ptychodera flava TaxID=63121 RepID=UPI00396A3F9A